MLIMILSITNIGNIKTAKAEEVKKAYINIGVGTGEYIDYDIDFSAYKAVKISKVYAYISSEKKIDITSAVTAQIKEGNYITRIKGRLTKENYNVDKKNIILPDMLSATDANRSDFDIPDKVEFIKYNDYDFKKDEYFSPGLSQYPSYREMIEYHFPRNENRLTWLKDPDTGQWRWMTNNDYVADVNWGIRDGGINQTNIIQASGKTYEVNGYKVNASSLQPVNNADYIYNYITAKYRYPVQDANFEDSSTWTKHPPFETGELANPYTIVGKFIALYNYGFIVHLQGIGEKQNDNILEIEYEGETAGTTPPPAPTEPEIPTPIGVPECSINAPKTIPVGEDCYITGSASTPNADGEIKDWYWEFNPRMYANDYQNMQGKSYGSVWFSKEGTYNVRLVVTDGSGMTAEAYKDIQAVPPIPTVTITTGGTLKENRKVILDASSSYSGSKRYPIDWTKAVWTITPVTDGITNEDIKVADSLTGSQKLNALFKKQGEYKVSCTLTNTYGKSATSEITIKIQPDLPPVADFTLTPKVARDPSDNNYATIDVYDKTHSDDGDIIEKRIWLYAFDSNNDGNFNNEQWYVYNNGSWQPYSSDYLQLKNIDIDTINDGNLTHVQVKSNHVGKYKLELIVRERFGQETISQFVTTKDQKTANTFDN